MGLKIIIPVFVSFSQILVDTRHYCDVGLTSSGMIRRLLCCPGCFIQSWCGVFCHFYMCSQFKVPVSNIRVMLPMTLELLRWLCNVWGLRPWSFTAPQLHPCATVLYKCILFHGLGLAFLEGILITWLDLSSGALLFYTKSKGEKNIQLCKQGPA